MNICFLDPFDCFFFCRARLFVPDWIVSTGITIESRKTSFFSTFWMSKVLMWRGKNRQPNQYFPNRWIYWQKLINETASWACTFCNWLLQRFVSWPTKFHLQWSPNVNQYSSKIVLGFPRFSRERFTPAYIEMHIFPIKVTIKYIICLLTVNLYNLKKCIWTKCLILGAINNKFTR